MDGDLFGGEEVVECYQTVICLVPNVHDVNFQG